MSNRQIKSYLNRIKPNDPNKNFFLEIILPSLKGKKSRQGLTYECPICVEKLSDNCSVETKLYTTYYTYIRHLGEQHKNSLPCNGLIFCFNSEQAANREEKIFKCNICDVEFSRKEHLNKHKLSIRHRETEDKQNQENEHDREYKSVDEEIIFIIEDIQSSNDSKNEEPVKKSLKRSRSNSSVSDSENISEKKIRLIDENIRNYLIEIENVEEYSKLKNDSTYSEPIEILENNFPDHVIEKNETVKEELDNFLIYLQDLDRSFENLEKSTDKVKPSNDDLLTNEKVIETKTKKSKDEENLSNIGNEDKTKLEECDECKEYEEDEDRQLLKLLDIYNL